MSDIAKDINDFEQDGERFYPTLSNPYEIKVNMERYLFALQFLKDRVVLDAGTGSGLATYLYSLVAKHVYSVDYSDEAQRYAKLYPFDPRKVTFIKADLEKDILPEHDITVALEVVEHLSNPDFFLSQLKNEELVFSVPVPSLPISKWHKYDFSTHADVRELFERYYDIDGYNVQAGLWVYGKGKKKKNV